MPNLSELFIYNGETRLEFIIWPIFLGVCIGAFLTVFIRMKLGAVVRAILEKGACSPQTALTLAELGMENKFFVRAALRGRSALRRLIDVVGFEAGEENEAEAPSEEDGGFVIKPLSLDSRPDLDKCWFYISDENRDRAEAMYDKTNSTLISAVLTVLIAFAVACLSMVVVPNLIDMAEGMFEGMKNK